MATDDQVVVEHLQRLFSTTSTVSSVIFRFSTITTAAFY